MYKIIFFQDSQLCIAKSRKLNRMFLPALLVPFCSMPALCTHDTTDSVNTNAILVLWNKNTFLNRQALNIGLLLDLFCSECSHQILRNNFYQFMEIVTAIKRGCRGREMVKEEEKSLHCIVWVTLKFSSVNNKKFFPGSSESTDKMPIISTVS